MKDSYEDEELDLYVGLESKNRTNLKTTTITVTATTTTKKNSVPDFGLLQKEASNNQSC